MNQTAGKVLKLMVAVTALWLISCGKKPNSGLNLSVTPGQPFMIAYGTGTTVSAWFKVTPGYFIINNLTLTWSGANNLELVAIVLQSGSTQYTVNCAYAGDDLTVLYPNNRVGTNVVINAAAAGATPTPVPSVAAGCGGITVPNPAPNSFNIPIQIKAIGAVIDASNNTVGRAQATANIVVQ